MVCCLGSEGSAVEFSAVMFVGSGWSFLVCCCSGISSVSSLIFRIGAMSLLVRALVIMLRRCFCSLRRHICLPILM